MAKMTPGQQAKFYLESAGSGYEMGFLSHEEARTILAQMKKIAPAALIRSRINAQEERVEFIRTGQVKCYKRVV